MVYTKVKLKWLIKINILSYTDERAAIAKKTWTEVEHKINQHIEDVSKFIKLNGFALNVQRMPYITCGN